MFLLGVDDTPSDEGRNQCASAFARSTISEYFESRSLRGGFGGGFGGGRGGVTERFSATSKTYPVARSRLFSPRLAADRLGPRFAAWLLSSNCHACGIHSVLASGLRPSARKAGSVSARTPDALTSSPGVPSAHLPSDKTTEAVDSCPAHYRANLMATWTGSGSEELSVSVCEEPS